MEILDPDLWNDDGTPKRPTKAYMASLDQAQQAQGGVFAGLVQEDLAAMRVDEPSTSYMNYARIKRETKAARPPEVGDIVHLWDHEQAVCRAAVVTQTEALNHDCELHVFVPRQAAEFWFAVHSETKGDESWHWPCGEGQ